MKVTVSASMNHSFTDFDNDTTPFDAKDEFDGESDNGDATSATGLKHRPSVSKDLLDLVQVESQFPPLDYLDILLIENATALFARYIHSASILEVGDMCRELGLDRSTVFSFKMIMDAFLSTPGTIKSISKYSELEMIMLASFSLAVQFQEEERLDIKEILAQRFEVPLLDIEETMEIIMETLSEYFIIPPHFFVTAILEAYKSTLPSDFVGFERMIEIADEALDFLLYR